MQIFRATVVRLYPTPAQEERLSSWAGAVRTLYNLALEQRQRFWRPGRDFNYVSQGREIKHLRRQVDWLADVPCAVLHQALRDLDRAYANWWGGARPPRFRVRGRDDAMRFSQSLYFAVRQTGPRSGVVKLPKIGGIAFRGEIRRAGRTWRNITVSRRGGHWYAACAYTAEAAPMQGGTALVGIDRGVRIFAALSSGEKIDGPNVGRRAAKALARAQRKLARKVKGSRNRDKQRRRVARLHMRAANARKDFLHRISTQIAKNHGFVVLEDLKVRNMTRRAHGQGRSAKSGLNRSILDQGWGMFRQMLAYKLAERGGQLILVPANDTSRTCAACGVVDKASRSGAHFNCTACGHTDDADTNAAINILRRGRAALLPAEGETLSAPDETGTSGRAA